MTIVTRWKQKSANAKVPLAALFADYMRVVDAGRRRGVRRPHLQAASDTSVWALTLLRGSAALRALFGSSFGLSQVLRTVFHIDVWSDQIGPGLRLPHPFNVVVGDGAELGAGCTLMHNVTVQRGEGTHVGDGATLATGCVVLAGAQIGSGALIGAGSVVRGCVPVGMVALGRPARAVRPLRESER
jgi:serine O-acetyltransferase